MKWAWDTEDPEWDPTARALWILEHGWDIDKVKFIYERVGSIVYKRPRIDCMTPPWWHTERVEIPDYDGDGFWI